MKKLILGILASHFLALAAHADALNVITVCDSIYGDSKITDSVYKEYLKHVDAKLTEVMVANGFLSVAIQQFIRVCKAMNGNLNQPGPKLDAFRIALFGIEAKKSTVSHLYNALQVKPESDIFAITSLDSVRKFNQPECMNDIIGSTNTLLDQSEALIKQTDIDCSNPPKK